MNVVNLKNKIKQPEGLKYLMKTGLGNFFT